MDDRRRIAGPVTDGASARPAADASPASRRMRARATRLDRNIRRWLGPLDRLPRGAGVAGAALLVFASIAFGAVRGGHMARLAEQFYDVCDAAAHAVGFRITSISV